MKKILMSFAIVLLNTSIGALAEQQSCAGASCEVKADFEADKIIDVYRQLGRLDYQLQADMISHFGIQNETFKTCRAQCHREFHNDLALCMSQYSDVVDNAFVERQSLANCGDAATQVQVQCFSNLINCQS